MKNYKRQLVCIFLGICMLAGMFSMQTSAALSHYENQGVYDYVLRMYEEILERTPDAVGLDDWCQRLVSGQESGAQIAYGFFNSSEYLSRNIDDATYVSTLYMALFNRTPDEIGYGDWIQRLNAGVDRLNILKGFVDSSEFEALCRGYGINKGTIETSQDGAAVYMVDQFVRRFYESALNRQPDAVGLDTWKRQLINQEISGAEMAYGFIFSQECMDQTEVDDTYVRVLYRVICGREPANSEVEAWLGNMAQGSSRLNVFCGFVNSQEFLSLCASYDITSGGDKYYRIREIDPQKPMIALTFDDGPSIYTPRVLDALQQNGQVATFFVVGTNASRYGSYIKHAYDMGCEIGNHSNSHLDFTRLSTSQIAREMDITNQYIYNAIGVYATVTRTPGGSYNTTVRNAVNSPIILWSIDTLDWKTRNTQKTIDTVLNHAKDGDIVLMHDIHKPTVAAAEVLIPELVARGFQLVTVSELAQYRGDGLTNGKVYLGFN